jgi:RHS repeat-associated protein
VTGETVRGSDRGERVRRRRFYDALGRPQAVQDARWGATQWAHDLDGNLTGERRGTDTDIYAIDATGAVQSIHDTDPLHAGPWTAQTGNVLLHAGAVDLGYDARRRRVRRTVGEAGSPSSTTRMRWDERDRLREITRPDGSRIRFMYDAFGRRTKKEVLPAPAAVPAFDFTALGASLGASAEGSATPPGHNGARTVEYVWDGDALAMEIDSDRGERVFAHVPETLVPLLHDEAGSVFVYVNDPTGAPRELVDARGDVVWAGRLSPWGRLLDEKTPTERQAIRPPFRLLGQVHDEDADLTCSKFRWWDAGVARWLSPDPIGIQGGPDHFGWGGDPLVHADPLGLSCYLLNNTAANSFTDGKYTVRTLDQDTVMWRAGVKGKPYGQYFDTTEPTSVAQVRNDKAILPKWPGPNGGESPIDAAFQHKVAAGTIVYDGTVAPQTGTDGTVYPGGTPQTVIPWGSHGSLTPMGEKELN